MILDRKVKGRPLIFAHRGDPSSAPENTLLAMEKAIEVGVDVLETDVRLTRDNELVLFHDINLERIAGRKERICDLTLEELLQFDFGDFFSPDGKTFPFRGKELRIVTLKEAFERFPSAMFNLDIKDKNTIAATLLAEVIDEYDRHDSVIVGSFHQKQVEHFRQLQPAVATAAGPSDVIRFLLGVKLRVPRLLVRKIAFRAFQVPLKQGRFSIITKKFIRSAHRQNIAVHVWTINERKEMEWLINLGVDGIFTNHPALLREVLHDLEYL